MQEDNKGESICFFLFVQGRQLRGMMTTRRVSVVFFHLSQGRQLKGRQTTRRKCLLFFTFIQGRQLREMKTTRGEYQLFFHLSKRDNWKAGRQLGESVKFFSILILWQGLSKRIFSNESNILWKLNRERKLTIHKEFQYIQLWKNPIM